MANLPTAYASQTFGRKTLDFYVASGDVNGADPRARADERRLTDLEGAKHTVRLVDRGFDLESGDQASVLRLQSGPARRSRPVAVVNHSRDAWSRTHPDASALLSRAGVARNVNWLLTMALLALSSLVLIWPYLRTFLYELDPGLFGAAPEFNVLALAMSALPDLAQWSFSDTVAPVSGLIASIWPASAEFADQIVFLSAATLGGLSVFALRSWRLLWAPLYVGVVGLAALALGGVEGAAGHALGAFGLTGAIFLVGGFINRVRDAARLNGRIALLSDHVLRHADEEGVSRSDVDAETVVEDASSDSVADTAAPVAVAASLADGDSTEEAEASEVDTESDDDAPAAEANDEDEIGQDADALADAALEDAESESADLSDAEPSEGEVISEAPDPTEREDAAVVEDDPTVRDEETTETDADEADAVDADASGDEAEAEDTASTSSSSEDAVESDGAEPVELSDGSNDDKASETVIDADAEPDEALTQEDAQTIEAESDAEAEDVVSAEAEEDDLDETNADGEDLELGGIDAEESERLKNDPRYAARAIVLPSPPPMPSETYVRSQVSAPEEPEADLAEEGASEPEAAVDDTTSSDEDQGGNPDAKTDEASVSPGAEPKSSETRALRPAQPLSADNVVPIFAAPTPPAPPAPPVPSPKGDGEVD